MKAAQLEIVTSKQEVSVSIRFDLGVAIAHLQRPEVEKLHATLSAWLDGALDDEVGLERERN